MNEVWAMLRSLLGLHWNNSQCYGEVEHPAEEHMKYGTNVSNNEFPKPGAHEHLQLGAIQAFIRRFHSSSKQKPGSAWTLYCSLPSKTHGTYIGPTHHCQILLHPSYALKHCTSFTGTVSVPVSIDHTPRALYS